MSTPIPTDSPPIALARRAFLGRTAQGLGSLALASLLDPALLRAGDLDRTASQRTHGGVLSGYHVPPRIRRVIFLCMAGGPSHLETFDYKPKLAEMDGKPMPASFTAGQPIAQLQGQDLVCLGPRFEFERHGDSGQQIASVLPHIASVADDICIIRSMFTDQINHDPAHTLLSTGMQIPGRPSMGSWVNYGLGTESDDLPGFVVMTSVGGRNPQPIATRQWHNGFLPSRHQGVQFHSKGAPVHYVNSPAGVDHAVQRDVVDAVAEINRRRNDVLADPEIASRISAYEMAFRMQTSVPQLRDFSDETAETLELYGTAGADGSFAANCLLARRLAERGVRFIQLYHRGWDHHNDIVPFMKECSGYCDQGTAALIKDLKRRGMLDETLIIWTGEFGRTPMSQAGKGEHLGRDHHIRGFSMFLAGGGIKGGLTHGATDDLGYYAVQDVVDIHDMHATMLHLFGIDHLRLTYRSQGRDFRLTDVAGRVVDEILA